jgi:hypothetical protein
MQTSCWNINRLLAQLHQWRECVSSVTAAPVVVVVVAADVRRHAPQLAPAAYDMAVGGVAGAVAVLVSMPFDVIKTYIQVKYQVAIFV